METNQYRKLFSNTVVITAGSIASKILVFFLVPFYTYCLSTQEFGTADLLSNAANLLIPIACLGITNALFRFGADGLQDGSHVFSCGILITAIASCVFLLLSPLLYGIPFFGNQAWLIVVYVLSANFHALTSQYLRAKGKMRIFALQGILNTALVIAWNLLFLLGLHLQVTGYVLSVVLADTVTGLVVFLGDRQYQDVRWNGLSADLIKSMLKYSLPLIPATIFWWITNVSDRYLVTWFCGENVNGIYAVAYKIPTILTLISGAFIDAWQLSSVSENQDNPHEKTAFFSNVYRFFLATVFLAAGLLVPLSRFLSSLLFSDAYYDAWQYMPFLICASLFTTLVSFLGSVYIIKLKSVVSFWTALIGAALNIILNIWWIPKFGAIGAAVATLIAYAVVYVLRAVTTHRLLPFGVQIVRTVIGTVLLIFESVVLYFNPGHTVLYEILLIIGMLAVFFKPFFEGLRAIFRMIFKKKIRNP